MAMVVMKNEYGVTKEVKKGFSWTMLFFGLFVPLIRGDLKWTIISLILAFITAGISWLVLPFFYNNVYIESLQEKGYRIVQQY